MKDTDSVHKKIQELCQCFSTTDPLKQMSALNQDEDSMEAALKWVAVAILHGVNSNAKKLTLKQKDDEAVSVTAEYRETQLPSPTKEVAGDIFDTIRAMTHIDAAKGKTKLALGLGDASLEFEISVKDKPGSRKVSIKFPDGS